MDGDARACVGLGDCSERGCLAGSGDGANERDRSRVGDHAADELALLVAEREAALCLYARDAIVRLGLGEDELAQGGSLGELRDSQLGGLQATGGEALPIQRDDLLEAEERVGRGEQGLTIGRCAERERELAHDVAAREGGVALGQAVLAEELLEDAAQSACVNRSWRVATGGE